MGKRAKRIKGIERALNRVIGVTEKSDFAPDKDRELTMNVIEGLVGYGVIDKSCISWDEIEDRFWMRRSDRHNPNSPIRIYRVVEMAARLYNEAPFGKKAGALKHFATDIYDQLERVNHIGPEVRP